MVQPLAKNVFIPLRKQKHHHQQMKAFMTWDLYFHIHMSSVLVTNSFQAFFPFTTKSVQYTVHLVSHFRANAVCFFSTLNPGFSVSIGLGEIVLTRCSLFILHFHNSIVFSIHPNASYILVWGPDIMMNKTSFSWHSCYTVTMCV